MVVVWVRRGGGDTVCIHSYACGADRLWVCTAQFDTQSRIHKEETNDQVPYWAPFSLLWFVLSLFSPRMDPFTDTHPPTHPPPHSVHYWTRVCGFSCTGSPPFLVAVPSRCGLTMESIGGMGASNFLYTTS